MDSGTRSFVRQRSHRCCEYCRLPDSADEWPFHVDHILARVHGGNDDVDNLSWSCTQCNLHKGPNFASVDPETLERVGLFNPREEEWRNHFTIGADARVHGLSAAGRATVRLLDMNGSPQLELRRALIAEGNFNVR